MLLGHRLALASLLGLLAALVSPAAGLENGLALTPPMGWINWARFMCQVDCNQYPDGCINSNLFTQIANRIVEDGFKQAGYEYVNIDDCWSNKQREPETERLLANASRFPEGIEGLADHVHSLGLKLGIYGDCGLKTCGGYPAQLRQTTSYLDDPLSSSRPSNFFQQDANMFAEWGIDSFKFDGCYIEAIEAESICPAMSEALAATKRPILLVCEWPFYMMYAHAEPNFTLAGDSCNVFRYYDDIEDSWLSILNTIDYTVRHQSTIVKYHGPGHWFDPDQLVIGNFGLSLQQAWAQMALWSVWSAPLYMSNDLRRIDQQSKAILTNEHLIAINQDKLGVFGLMVKEIHQHDNQDHYQAFVKPVLPIRHECPSFALVYLNRNTLGGQVKVSFKLGDLLIGAPLHVARLHALELFDREPDNPVAEEAAKFAPSRCIEWLRKATRDSSAQESNEDAGNNWKTSSSDDDEDNDDDDDNTEHSYTGGTKVSNRLPVAKFKVFDLIEGKYLFDERALGTEEELALPVDLNGVRAVRLEAI